MKKMTQTDLEAAFAGESQAHVKYAAFADKAEQEGKANVARLFRAASFAEQVHATKHLKTLSGIGGTSDNLEAAMGGEGFEVDEMYPAYMAVADAQAEPAAHKTFSRAFEAEKVHRALYKKAKEAVDAGGDADAAPVWVCDHCGFTGEGEAPDRCPLCGAAKERIRTF